MPRAFDTSATSLPAITLHQPHEPLLVFDDGEFHVHLFCRYISETREYKTVAVAARRVGKDQSGDMQVGIITNTVPEIPAPAPLSEAAERLIERLTRTIYELKAGLADD